MQPCKGASVPEGMSQQDFKARQLRMATLTKKSTHKERREGTTTVSCRRDTEAAKRDLQKADHRLVCRAASLRELRDKAWRARLPCSLCDQGANWDRKNFFYKEVFAARRV